MLHTDNVSADCTVLYVLVRLCAHLLELHECVHSAFNMYTVCKVQCIYCICMQEGRAERWPHTAGGRSCGLRRLARRHAGRCAQITPSDRCASASAPSFISILSCCIHLLPTDMLLHAIYGYLFELHIM